MRGWGPVIEIERRDGGYIATLRDDSREWSTDTTVPRRTMSAKLGEFGMHAMSHRPGVLGMPEAAPPLVKYAITYLFVQAEFGLMCPISVSDTSNFIVKRYGSAPLKGLLLERLLSQDMDTLLKGTQFMTEKAGGSDVGAIETEAEPVGVGADGGDVDQRLGTDGRRSLRDIGRAFMMKRVEIACQYANEIDDDVSASDGAGDAFGLANVGHDELRLAQSAERLDPKCVGDVSLRHANPRATCKQRLRHLTAQETATAKHRNQTILHHASHI